MEFVTNSALRCEAPAIEDLNLDDAALLRYSRHILLPEIGIEGQACLQRARALIIGAGGLGSPAALYLALSGVGTLAIADGDTVDLTNLQRQILHTQDAVGRRKVDSAQTTLLRYNPGVVVQPVPIQLAGEDLERQVEQSDIVLDCCDNFATRHAINQACVRYRKPLVSGSAIRFDGQITVFDVREARSPCYHCLFPEGEDVESLRCAVMGVFAPLTGIIGAMQAAEALKCLTGAGTPLIGRLQLLDGLTMQWRSIGIPRDPHCSVCSRERVEMQK